jgi:hypothetical protein
MHATKRLLLLTGLILGLAVFGSAVAPANAATTCTFTTSGTTMQLNSDCTTDATILVPNGFTLNGRNHTITGVDPPGDHFRGAVVSNGGTIANVTRLGVTMSGLANVCDAGADRIRGIMFDGASGRISKNTVTNINQGQSGCQEGNDIEVRNAPFDGTHPATKTVRVDDNTVLDYQKTGIVANGDVSVDISHNDVGAGFVDSHLIAANSIQLGFGALGTIEHNKIDGNQWCGSSDDAATAILLFDQGTGAVVSHNDISGNSDVGIYIGGDLTTIVGGDFATVEHNKVNDDPSIADCNVHNYDIGIGNYGGGPTPDPTTNDVNHNTVRGFDTPFDGPVGDHNKSKAAH